MKKLVSCLLVTVMILNYYVTAGAEIKISVDGKNFNGYSEAARQKIIDLFRELELVSSRDTGTDIFINVTHSSSWSLEKSIEALKSSGIDQLIPYGETGLEYLRSHGGEGWRYIEECGEAGLNFLKVCGQAGLEYILSEGVDGWEYLQRCGDAGIEFLKSLGNVALYLLLNGNQFGYFVQYLGEDGLKVLMPYANEALNYLMANGDEAWDYLKDCSVKGFEFLKACGENGLDYILSFGKAGLDYLLSFGEDGWNFLMSYYDNGKIIRNLSKDIPALSNIDSDDDKSVKNYLETYKTLGRDVLESYGNEALEVIRDWTPGKSDAPKNENVLEMIIPNAVNVYEAAEVKKFLEADALEWIDFIADFKDKDYFKEGILNFCREYPNSLSSYGFVDREYLMNTIRKFYGGRFSLQDNKKFMFRLSGNTVLWNNTIKSTGENAFFSLKTLRPGKGGDILNLALRLLQTVRDTKIDSRHAIRLFFRTNYDWLRVVAVIREGVPPTYYLAGNKTLVERNSLAEALMNPDNIELDSSMEDLMFNLLKPDSRLQSSANLDTCLYIFIEQVLAKLEGK